MSALANILSTGTFLGIMAILLTGVVYGVTHGVLRSARTRSSRLRQREQQRREYWGYE